MTWLMLMPRGAVVMMPGCGDCAAHYPNVWGSTGPPSYGGKECDYPGQALSQNISLFMAYMPRKTICVEDDWTSPAVMPLPLMKRMLDLALCQLEANNRWRGPEERGGINATGACQPTETLDQWAAAMYPYGPNKGLVRGAPEMPNEGGDTNRVS